MRYILIIGLCGLYLSGCATISRGSKTTLLIDTEPKGALVITDKELPSSIKRRKKDSDAIAEYYSCPATPCGIKMPRRSEFLMTIKADGYEDIEIGVDNGIHKESLTANLAGSGAVGAVNGLAVGALVGGLTGTGIAAGTAAAAAGIVTGGLLVVSVGVDAASGAILNLRPNPVILTLPPKGTEFLPHPKAEKIRAKRAQKSKLQDDQNDK